MGMAYSAVEKRKKGEVLLKASACDASARAPISVLAMLSSARGWLQLLLAMIRNSARPAAAADDTSPCTLSLSDRLG